MGKLDTHKKAKTKYRALVLKKVSSESYKITVDTNPETRQVNCFKMSLRNAIPEKESNIPETNKNWRVESAD